MATSIHPPVATAPLPLQPPPELNSKWIELSKVIPSRTNPDRTFDAKRDADLLESIRAGQVHEPVIVRVPGVKGCSFTKTGHFELVAGERRYHCSVKAGKGYIPAVIKELTDVEVLEIQYVENDQREDLTPLGKAKAAVRLWEAYSEQGVPTHERLKRMSERIGRKTRTVWNVLSLGRLIPEGQKLLDAGEISLSHVYEICRRPKSVQKEIVEFIIGEQGTGDRMYGRVSVRDLQDYIREEFDKFLSSAPFDTKSATLVETAGPCTECQKNTAVNPDLVDESEAKGKHGGKHAICTDRNCWDEKVQANLVQIENAAKEEGASLARVSFGPVKDAVPAGEWKEVGGKSCAHAHQAVIVDGDLTGKKIVACLRASKCKTHWPHGEASAHRRQPSRPRSEEEKRTMLQKSRNKKADQTYRTAACREILQKVKELRTLDMQEVALVLYQRLDYRLQNPVCEAMGWKGNGREKIQSLNPAQLAGFMALLTVADNILPGVDYVTHSSPIKAEGFAKRHKIDLVKIEATATAPLRERWKQIDARKKAKAKAQTSARKKVKGAAA